MQVASLSRGSSTESSLKRTKRKAPLPPTTPGAAVQETVPVKENSQGLSVYMCTFPDHSVGLLSRFIKSMSSETSERFQITFSLNLLPPSGNHETLSGFANDISF